jgi:hypothetical protein
MKAMDIGCSGVGVTVGVGVSVGGGVGLGMGMGVGVCDGRGRTVVGAASGVVVGEGDAVGVAGGVRSQAVGCTPPQAASESTDRVNKRQTAMGSRRHEFMRDNRNKSHSFPE